MEDFTEVEAILREIAKDGVFSGMMADDLEELIRLINQGAKKRGRVKGSLKWKPWTVTETRPRSLTEEEV